MRGTAMASTSHLLQTLSIQSLPKAPPKANVSTPIPAVPRASSRRQLLLLLTSTTVLTAVEFPAGAQDIPLFGLRKKLKKVEEEAEEIVKEGFESAEKGIEAAEIGIEAAEKGIQSAEKEIESAVSVSGFAQAGVVAGAEFVGVLLTSSVVNGILGPEGQKA